MSLKTTRKGQSFESVASGSTAVTRLPTGLSYERILIPYTGVTLAQMTEIRLVANGEVIRIYRDVEKMDLINQFDGMAAAAGILTVNLVRHGLRTRAAEELTKVGTGVARSENNPNPITTLSLEIDIHVDAVAPVFGAPKLHQDLPNVTGAILKTKQYIYNPTGAGIFEIADYPKGELINRIFFFGTGIKSLEVERNNFISFTRDVAENTLLQSEGVRVPQTDVYVYDPTENGNGSEGLTTASVSDLRFRLDMAGAAQVEMLVETLSTLKV
jgi:hypothetical protein